MASEVYRKVRLIALEGARGPVLTAAAKRLLRHFIGRKISGGISEWDASNIFFELGRCDLSIPGPSPRTLLLLYASDLSFRLRWEIRPALEEGQCVIAAPYVESAMAFGKAVGLPRRWLVELFRFAPKPQACYRIQEQQKSSAMLGEPSEGYLEFCCSALTASSPLWDPAELRGRFLAYLDALERRQVCQTLSE